MKKNVMISLILFFAVSSCTKNEVRPTRPEFSKIAWILGSWEGKDSNTVYYEHWKEAGKELFEGRAVVIVKGDTVFSERVTIEVKDSILVYRVVIGKNDPVLFKLIAADEQSVSFSNPQHDFPQNIAYKLQPDGSLYAYVDGMNGKQYKKEEYFYQRMK